MTVYEMEGFLRGKCLPVDMKVNESNAQYLVRKFSEFESNLSDSKREFRASDATIHNLELKLTDMAVQLANAESKCMEQAAEISRRDEIFIPVYPDNNLMNKMTDVFHDTAKIHCDEDGIFVDNAELVITSIINNYIKSDDAFLAEVRAQESKRVYESILDNPSVTDMESLVDWLEQNANDSASFAAQLRKGVQS
ncbi:hypothetical protein BED43_18840 [Citrobacter freundii]|uniref:hypothetical protein n=1 Tax=Citrobacter freundii TaxID=546 RepID=UPI0008FCE0BB|nr:hypothetical protein [Citrobacter freundii]OIY13230.1 hypothetical protein BED43_18840 [Citrobacter freundii]OIZ54430.1 hypothetical protein BEH74_18630 [Citrobacter freundii]